MIFSRSSSAFMGPAGFYAAVMLLLPYLEEVGPTWSPKPSQALVVGLRWPKPRWRSSPRGPWAAAGTSPGSVSHGRVRPFLQADGSSSPGSALWLADLQVGLFLGKETVCCYAAVSEKMTMPKRWKFGRYKFNVVFWPPLGSPGNSYKGWRDRAVLGEPKGSVRSCGVVPIQTLNISFPPRWDFSSPW